MVDDTNLVIISGNICKDPEIRQLPNGTSVLNACVASNRSWKDKDGSYKKDATFVNFDVFGKYAEMLAKHMPKGSSVTVQGRLSIKAVEQTDGSKKYYTKINCDSLKLHKKGGGTANGDDLSSPSAPGGSDAGADETPF